MFDRYVKQIFDYIMLFKHEYHEAVIKIVSQRVGPLKPWCWNVTKRADLKCSHDTDQKKKNTQLCEVTDVLINLVVDVTEQCIHTSSYRVAHLKYT